MCRRWVSLIPAMMTLFWHHDDPRFTAVSLNEDVDTNKELVGHGYSNLLSGLLGTV